MSRDPREYRVYAIECAELASSARTLEFKVMFSELSRGWETLALAMEEADAKHDYQDMARKWRGLAESYLFVKWIECFLAEQSLREQVAEGVTALQQPVQNHRAFCGSVPSYRNVPYVMDQPYSKYLKRSVVMETEIVQLASITPFLVLNAIGLMLTGAAALIACVAQRHSGLVATALPSQNMALNRAA